MRCADALTSLPQAVSVFLCDVRRAQGSLSRWIVSQSASMKPASARTPWEFYDAADAVLLLNFCVLSSALLVPVSVLIAEYLAKLFSCIAICQLTGL